MNSSVCKDCSSNTITYHSLCMQSLSPLIPPFSRLVPMVTNDQLWPRLSGCSGGWSWTSPWTRVRTLASDWSTQITWHEHWPLIGQSSHCQPPDRCDWCIHHYYGVMTPLSRHYTGLWLVSTNHVTWILTSDWSSLFPFSAPSQINTSPA